jgi:hypothetical protein
MLISPLFQFPPHLQQQPLLLPPVLHMKFKPTQGVQMVGKKTGNLRNQKDPSTQSHNNLNQR